MSREFSLDFPRAYPATNMTADFRLAPEDFQVEEDLGFAPAGEGEHWLLQIRKRGTNTAWLASQIARVAGVDDRDLGFCGRKDRHAVTSQWFSVYRPKGDKPQWHILENDDIQLLQVARHNRKLRRGDHLGNRFVIRLRNLQCPDRPALEQTLARVFASGVPNYFGEQRFGRDAGNLHAARQLLSSGGWRRRHRGQQGREMALSAARAWLFNQVLAERVRRDNWQVPLPGEPQPEATGPLWGRGRDRGPALEAEVLAPWSDWCDMLEHTGMVQERRALALQPSRGRWHWPAEDCLELVFTLGRGEFATALLRELGELHNCAGGA